MWNCRLRQSEKAPVGSLHAGFHGLRGLYVHVGRRQDAKKHFGDRIDVVEYMYNTPENISRIKKMGVKQLPSLYLNGELKYSSLIPNLDDLIRQIEEAL